MAVNRTADMDNVKFKLANNVETPKQKLCDYLLILSSVFGKDNTTKYMF